MGTQNLNSNLKRVANAIANSKGKRQSSMDRLRSMRTFVPNKRMAKMSNKQEGVISGVVVSGSQGPERKKYDNLVATPQAVNTGAPYIASLTSGIAEATTIAGRIGGRIHIKAIDAEINVGCTVGSTVTAPQGNQVYIDVMCVWDKQPDGSVPSAGAVFVSTTTNLTLGNVNNLERFQVLRRERISMDVASGLSQIIKWNVPCEAAVRFGDSTGSPQTNDFYIMALSPNAAASTSTIAPVISYLARVHYTDE